MELEHYQRALLELCFAARAPAELPNLALYRELVRGRFLAMAKVAYRRTFLIVGEPALGALFAGYLTAEPPRSPYIREVIGGFAPYALTALRGAAELPSYACDVLRFEAAKWEVASALEDDGAPAPMEVDFAAPLALNPTLRVLSLAHGVIDREGSEQEVPPPTPQVVLVYRRPGEDEVRWYRSGGLFAKLLTLPDVHGAPLAALVQQAAGTAAVDEPMLEQLAEQLSVAVERQVVLGSRVLDESERSF